MKAGEIYEVVEGSLDGYLSVRLPDGSVTSMHWAPKFFFEEVFPVERPDALSDVLPIRSQPSELD